MNKKLSQNTICHSEYSEEFIILSRPDHSPSLRSGLKALFAQGDVLKIVSKRIGVFFL